MTNATLQTNHGAIDIELFDEDAPKTVENFKKLAQDGFYDGVIFHRVISDFMIQGGDPTGTGSGGPGYQFEDEFNDHKVERGALAMANAGPNTNGSQFFIVTADACPWLDGKHTVFGRVTVGHGRRRRDRAGRHRPGRPAARRGADRVGLARLTMSGDVAPEEHADIVCPHCKKTFSAEPDRRLGRALSRLQVPALPAVRAALLAVERSAATNS